MFLFVFVCERTLGNEWKHKQNSGNQSYSPTNGYETDKRGQPQGSNAGDYADHGEEASLFSTVVPLNPEFQSLLKETLEREKEILNTQPPPTQVPHENLLDPMPATKMIQLDLKQLKEASLIFLPSKIIWSKDATLVMYYPDWWMDGWMDACCNAVFRPKTAAARTRWWSSNARPQPRIEQSADYFCTSFHPGWICQGHKEKARDSEETCKPGTSELGKAWNKPLYLKARKRHALVLLFVKAKTGRRPQWWIIFILFFSLCYEMQLEEQIETEEQQLKALEFAYERAEREERMKRVMEEREEEEERRRIWGNQKYRLSLHSFFPNLSVFIFLYKRNCLLIVIFF